jgi:hypothetical protein
VQLRVHFKRGLHPFYPPAVQIIRPHFANPIAGAVSSHPMLKLQNWQPMRSLRELFDEIKAFLEVGPAAGAVGLGWAAGAAPLGVLCAGGGVGWLGRGSGALCSAWCNSVLQRKGLPWRRLGSSLPGRCCTDTPSPCPAPRRSTAASRCPTP